MALRVPKYLLIQTEKDTKGKDCLPQSCRRRRCSMAIVCPRGAWGVARTRLKTPKAATAKTLVEVGLLKTNFI